MPCLAETISGQRDFEVHRRPWFSKSQDSSQGHTNGRRATRHFQHSETRKAEVVMMRFGTGRCIAEVSSFESVHDGGKEVRTSAVRQVKQKQRFCATDAI